jgi:peptidoglycan hydrolase-like protein with peptidoglycan-binding domain
MKLQQGNSGDGVTVLQRALRYCVGRNISIDGDYGPQTAAAVLWFQDHINDTSGGGTLIEDGIYGPETRNWMPFPRWTWPANVRTSQCENIPA